MYDFFGIDSIFHCLVTGCDCTILSGKPAGIRLNGYAHPYLFAINRLSIRTHPMLLSKLVLLLILESIIFLVVAAIALLLLFLSQKKKNIVLSVALSDERASAEAEPVAPSLTTEQGYGAQLDASLKQLSDALPEMMPCSDPQQFAVATEQEQAKIVRYLVLDYEKTIIENIEHEEALAAPFVSSIDILFSNKKDKQESESAASGDTTETEAEPNAEIEQLNNQNRMNQEVIDQFARESREMLNCINTLESENKDLRKLLDVKSGRQ
ncbi:MAG: hypothetical protein KUG67_02430 [Proteobacteria bacterium]|nr:hypothetical protein [Pseudomonadota bacterium]